MGRAPSHKTTRRGPMPSYRQNTCQKQFPDCPATPNSESCQKCPLWGTGTAKQYLLKEEPA